MRFLKILGMVVALHVVLFTIFLLSPGCQSNPTTPAPTSAPTASNEPAPASSLAPMPVDEMGNYTSQPAASTATTSASVSSNPVSTTISSAPLPGSFDDSGRSAPARPANPEGYVSTGDRPPPALNPPPTTHVIRAGDNLGKIAAQYGTSVSALQRANPGIKPQSLRVGQQIKLPANLSSSAAAPESPAAISGASYTVKAGDSLSAIAARNGTTVVALRQANNLRGNNIQVGQQLVIPGTASTSAAASTPRTEYTAPAASTTRSSSTISGDASTASAEYTLKSGDTLGAIAKRYGVTVDQIMAANNITDPRRVRAGQKLTIPGAAGRAASSAARTPAPAPTQSTPPPASEPAPSTEPLPEPEPLLPADMTDAPPIPVDDEPTPSP